MKSLLTLCAVFLICTATNRATFGSELKSYNFGTSDIVRDDTRDRVYCAVPQQNSVVVIDSESLQVVASIFTGSQPAALDVSADGKELYVANQGSTLQGIVVVDLETLTIVRSIATTTSPGDVAVGNGTVYALEGSAIRAYATADGTPRAGSLSGVFVYGGILEISPDGNTLYYYQTGLSPSSWFRIQVGTWPGSVVQSGAFGSNGQDMTLSGNGQWITFASGHPYYVRKLQASDPSVSLGEMGTGAYPRSVTYSPDSTYLFAVHTSGHIDVWNASTYVLIDSIPTPGQPMDLECDRKGKVLFAGTGTDMRAYLVGATNANETINMEIHHAVEVRWNSVSGSLYQVEWKSTPNGNSDWYSVGGPILGNGLTMSVFDTTRGNRAKFYRVRLISQ